MSHASPRLLEAIVVLTCASICVNNYRTCKHFLLEAVFSCYFYNNRDVFQYLASLIG